MENDSVLTRDDIKPGPTGLVESITLATRDTAAPTVSHSWSLRKASRRRTKPKSNPKEISRKKSLQNIGRRREKWRCSG